MNQLFYNIAGGIVHQIRREKRTTISEVMVAVHHIIFFPALTMATCAKKILAKQFAQTISVHYRDFEHAYVY